MQLLSVLLNATNSSTAANYLPIGLLLIFAGGFVATMLALSAMVDPKRQTKDKLATFTSGIESHGDAREPITIKYFLVAILFVLFDVEVIFFYPYAINFKELGWNGFLAVLMFVSFF
jgi:NADH-quinone oxidoreductase subunit A